MTATPALEVAVSGSSSASAMPASLAAVGALTSRRLERSGGALAALGLLFSKQPAGLVCLVLRQGSISCIFTAALRPDASAFDPHQKVVHVGKNTATSGAARNPSSSGEEEAGPANDPALTVEGDAAARHNHAARRAARTVAAWQILVRRKRASC
jgi:hypothetical protein